MVTLRTALPESVSKVDQKEKEGPDRTVVQVVLSANTLSPAKGQDSDQMYFPQTRTHQALPIRLISFLSPLDPFLPRAT